MVTTSRGLTVPGNAPFPRSCPFAVATGHFSTVEEAAAAMARPGEIITPNVGCHERSAPLYRTFLGFHRLLRQHYT